jgi:hypothetical protein
VAQSGAVPTTKRLEVYLQLERAMLAIDKLDEAVSDHLREMMDNIWYDLTDEDLAWLNQRASAKPRRDG